MSKLFPWYGQIIPSRRPAILETWPRISRNHPRYFPGYVCAHSLTFTPPSDRMEGLETRLFRFRQSRGSHKALTFVSLFRKPSHPTPTASHFAANKKYFAVPVQDPSPGAPRTIRPPITTRPTIPATRDDRRDGKLASRLDRGRAPVPQRRPAMERCARGRIQATLRRWRK